MKAALSAAAPAGRMRRRRPKPPRRARRRAVVEGRHARRVRERAERHAARAKAAGLGAGGAGDAMHQRLLAEVAARAAASMTALAA